MSAAVFRAHDARERAHLLGSIADAFERPVSVEHVAAYAYEGDETSLYLWTFYDVGVRDGIRYGKRRGRQDAFRPGPDRAVARAKARQARQARKQTRAKR